MASEEGPLVLGDKGARAGAQDSNLGLDILNVIVVGLEINLVRVSSVQDLWTGSNGWTYVLDGDRVSRCFFDSLVDYSKASTCEGGRSVSLQGIHDGGSGEIQLTAKLLQNLVVRSKTIGSHCGPSSHNAQLLSGRRQDWERLKKRG